MDTSWRLYVVYTLVLIIVLWAGTSYGQVRAIHFNAEWNKANAVEWVKKLKDCDITYVDIAKTPKLQTKHKVVVVPTIIIYKDGEEVERFQADISFKMAATKEEVQEIIDELIMSDF